MVSENINGCRNARETKSEVKTRGLMRLQSERECERAWLFHGGDSSEADHRFRREAGHCSGTQPGESHQTRRLFANMVRRMEALPVRRQLFFPVVEF
jgi:hypothetical protein